MKRLPILLTLLLLPMAQAAAGASLQDDATPQDAQVKAFDRGANAITKASRFAAKHSSLRYTIFDYRKALGLYTQKTKLITLKNGTDALELRDIYDFFRNDLPRSRRTRLLVNQDYDLLEVQANLGKLGKMGIRVRKRVLEGQSFDGKPFRFDVPKHMMSTDMLQRGLYDLPMELGKSISVNMFTLDKTAEAECTGKVDIIYRGIEDVLAQGITYSCRKYVARAEGEKRATQYWFDAEQRMIKLKTGNQIWELIPKGQAEPLPVKRKPNPLRQRKKKLEKEAKDAEREKQGPEQPPSES